MHSLAPPMRIVGWSPSLLQYCLLLITKSNAFPKNLHWAFYLEITNLPGTRSLRCDLKHDAFCLPASEDAPEPPAGGEHTGGHDVQHHGPRTAALALIPAPCPRIAAQPLRRLQRTEEQLGQGTPSPTLLIDTFVSTYEIELFSSLVVQPKGPMTYHQVWVW